MCGGIEFGIQGLTILRTHLVAQQVQSTMYHLLPIHAFCTHIKHYPEFCCVATTFEYRVMRQVKVSSLSSPLSPDTSCICSNSSYASCNMCNSSACLVGTKAASPTAEIHTMLNHMICQVLHDVTSMVTS